MKLDYDSIISCPRCGQQVDIMSLRSYNTVQYRLLFRPSKRRGKQHTCLAYSKMPEMRILLLDI